MKDEKNMEIKGSRTSRGFRLYEGVDLYGHPFSLQESSLASEACVWFGIDKPDLQEDGWHPEWPFRCREYKLPENVHVFGRMHLTQDQVRQLIPLLQHFVDHGSLPFEDD